MTVYFCDRCGKKTVGGNTAGGEVPAIGWKGEQAPIDAARPVPIIVTAKFVGPERFFGDSFTPDLCPDCKADMLEELASRIRTA